MHTIDVKRFTLARIDAFIHQIQKLSESDFPYKDSLDALQIVSGHFEKQRNDVEQSLLEGDDFKSRCSVSTNELSKFHRFLGYLAKSSDPTNSFEIYFSFRRIAESILGKKIGLIMNSDWESYSPVNFNRPNELVDFVFIGLPVSESENTLIIPLAGHELGHSIWMSEKLATSSFEQKYRQTLQATLGKPNGKLKEKEASFVVDVTLRKCAEYFCDFIGLGLFGTGYLYAFAYLIAPKISKSLGSSHPNASNRATAMIRAAGALGYDTPPNFQDLFKNLPQIHFEHERLQLTESASFALVDPILEDVKRLLSEKKILYRQSDNYEQIKNNLLEMVPISSSDSLAEVINAGWDIYFTENKWENEKIGEEKEKIALLNELMLKSFEILEFKQRIKNVT